jgi:hypothetical protein
MVIYTNQFKLEGLQKNFNLIELVPNRFLDENEIHYVIQTLRRLNQAILFFNYNKKIMSLSPHFF